jgi:hypothetical protein
VACNEGSYEVVRLLLAKGAPIDLFNHQNKNCLDIAIERGHREVIKVLLRDPGWYKLFQSEAKITVTRIERERFRKKSKNITVQEVQVIESPQFNAM